MPSGMIQPQRCMPISEPGWTVLLIQYGPTLTDAGFDHQVGSQREKTAHGAEFVCRRHQARC